MKVAIYGSMLGTLLLLSACNKSAEGNKSVVKEEIQMEKFEKNGKIDSTSKSVKTTTTNGKTTTETTYRYVATDGASAKVTFIKSDEGEKINIFSNKKAIIGDLESTANGKSTYKNQDITITSVGDSLKIEQGGQIIELRKARGI